MKRRLIFPGIDGTLNSPGHNTPPDSAPEIIRAARSLGRLRQKVRDTQVRVVREKLLAALVSDENEL